MQRRRLIVGFVEIHQSVEQGAKEALDMRPFKGKVQGEGEKAGNRDDLRRQ